MTAGGPLPPLEPLELTGEHLRVTVDVGRGATIRHLATPGGVNVLAERTWEAPLPAANSSSYGDERLDWHADYPGGWQELFANAGEGCVVDGVPMPFHGEASTARWDVLAHAEDAAHLRVASRLPVVLERRMRLAPDRPALLLEETVHNLAEHPVAVLWAHHPAFTAAAGMRIDAPAVRVHVDEDWRPAHLDLQAGAEGRWPQAPGRPEPVDLSLVPAKPAERLCYLPDLAGGWAALRDPGTDRGVALAWDNTVWPHLWLWQEIGGSEFPWYGQASIVALEPHRAWPADGLAAARSRGQALVVAPRGATRAWLTVALFTGAERPVTGVARDGRVGLACDGVRP